MSLDRPDLKARLRQAALAGRQRRELNAALASGQISRRDLVRWGLVTTGGLAGLLSGIGPIPSRAAQAAGLAVPCLASRNSPRPVSGSTYSIR